MELEAKLCPQCLSEFVATAERCSDCDVPLVRPDEIQEPPELEELPPISELVPIRISSIDWARGLSGALQAAEISHRIGEPPAPSENSGAERRSHDLGVGVFVLPQDRERASVIDAEYARSQIPDLEDVQLAGQASQEDECPACGEAIAADDPECGGCGLPFIDME